MAKKKEESAARLRVGNVECPPVDLSKLKLGEVVAIERYFGRSMDDIQPSDWDSATGSAVIAYIARHRVDKDWTIEKTEALEPDELEVLEDERPTGSRKTSGSRSSEKSSG
jgi:hypothetical protein